MVLVAADALDLAPHRKRGEPSARRPLGHEFLHCLIDEAEREGTNRGPRGRPSARTPGCGPTKDQVSKQEELIAHSLGIRRVSQAAEVLVERPRFRLLLIAIRPPLAGTAG